MRDYLKFFKEFEPHIQVEDDPRAFDPNANPNAEYWEIFTVPTQWMRGFLSYEDAVHCAMDYIKKGEWKPDESSFSRFIQNMEKDDYE